MRDGHHDSGSRKKRGRRRGMPKRNENLWYKPTLTDVYAQLTVARSMLDRVKGAEMVKREMYILDEMIQKEAGWR